MSDHLSESDVRALVRLLGETVSVEGDHTVKKRYLMDGLCKLVDADAWVWGLMCQPGDGKPQIYVNLVHGGFDDDRYGKYLKALDHPEMSWVAQRFFQDLESEGCQVTRRRDQIVEDDVYLKTEASGLWLDADIGSLMMSARALDQSASTIGIYRGASQSAFTERESRIAHIVLSEVPWLHEMGWPEDRGVTVPRLNRRLRLVLNLLLEGFDRKTIADQLGISVHTVGDYCKEIYSHFAVSSQSALLARFFQGNGGDRPRDEVPGLSRA